MGGGRPVFSPGQLACFAVAGGVLAAAGGVWVWGAVAGLVTGGGVPAVSFTQAGYVVVSLPGRAGDPAQAWPAGARRALPGPAVMYAVAVALVGVCGVAAVRALVWWSRRNGADRLGGDSHAWAVRADLADGGLLTRGPAPGRLTVGALARRLLTLEAEHSAIVVGATRSGKTAGLVVPAVLEWDGPAIVVSAKGDVYGWTRGHRSTLGRVRVFDPAATTGQPSDGWTPLSTSHTWLGAQRTAASMVSVSRLSGMKDGGFWETNAAELLAPLLLAAADQGLGMDRVLEWVTTQSLGEPVEILKSLAEDDRALSAAARAVGAFARLDDRNRNNFLTTAKTALVAYLDPGVLAASHRPDITPEGLLDGQANTLYVVAGAHDQRRLAPLILTLLDTHLRAAFAKAETNRAGRGRPVPDGGRRLLVVLDEAANIAPLPTLDTVASMGGGEGVQLLTVYQDLSQVVAEYGRDKASTIVSNHVAKVILPGITDEATLSTFTKVIGEEAVVETSEQTSTERWGRNRTRSVRRRPVIDPGELRRIPEGSGVLIYGNRPPARLRLRPWFDDPTLTRQVNTAPHQSAGRREHKEGPMPKTMTAQKAADYIECGLAVPIAVADPPPIRLPLTGEFYMPARDGGYVQILDHVQIEVLTRAARREAAAGEAVAAAEAERGGAS